MKRFKAWFKRLFTRERIIYVQHEKVDYQGLGRPFDIYDWERLAIMYSWGEVFYRFVALEIQNLDEEERRLPLSADKDRERLSISIRRACLKDIQRIPDTAAARVTEAYNKSEPRSKEKGLNNHGK